MIYYSSVASLNVICYRLVCFIFKASSLISITLLDNNRNREEKNDNHLKLVTSQLFLIQRKTDSTDQSNI